MTRAYVMQGPGAGRVEEIPPPRLGAYDAVVRMRACGICNTTDRMVRNGVYPPEIAFPSILGHESVGEVVDVGPKVRSLRVGQLVTRPSAYPLDDAPVAQNWGGLSEAGVVRDVRAMIEDGAADELTWLARQQCALDDGDPALAALAISVSEVVSIARPVSLPTARVVVIGTGIAGLSLTMLASRAGAQTVVAVGRRDERLARAQACGADHGVLVSRADADEEVRRLTGGGADVVFEASGDPAMVARGAGWCRPGGALVAYGISSEAVELNWQALPLDVSVTFPSTREQDVYAHVYRSLETGALPAELLLTHRFSFSDVAEALRVVDAGETVKAIVTFD